MNKNKKSERLLLNSLCVLMSGLGLGWLVGLSASPVIQIILTSLIAIVVSLSGALAGISATKQEDDPPQDNNKRRSLSSVLDPLPVMCLVIGLAIGSSIGVYARTNDWLGAVPKPQKTFAEEWSDTGLPKEEITKRIFYSLYPGFEESKSPTNFSPEKENSNTQSVSQDKPSSNTETEKEEKSEKMPRSLGKIVKPAKRTEQTTQSINKGILFANPSPEDCETLRGSGEQDLRRKMAQLPTKIELNRLSRTCKTIECLKAGVKRLCPNL